MKIFVLAGGFGTRLQNVVSGVPKPMAPIGNKPFLEYQIHEIRKFYPDIEIVILTHYKSEVIEEYYKNRNNIKIIKENKPLGTGGSILNAISILKLKTKETLLVLNGDTYLEVNLIEMVNSTKYDVTLLSSWQENCSRYGTLEIKNDTISAFKEKKSNSKNSYINAGCYYFKNLDFFDINNKIDNSFSL